MNNPLISIIVPVYNVEEYLDRCVNSIVNQTYQKLEIILVDDGSTDSSGKKCDEWKEKDNRIIVIHKENGGQASARNKGINISNGELIGFVDSDDYIDLTMYESMLRILVETDSDIVECNMLRFENQEDDCCVSGTGEKLEMDQKESIYDFITEDHLQCTVPNMLLKREIAKSVLFEEGKTHEDILWPYRVYMLSNKVTYIDLTYYFYYQRSDSTMNRAYSERRFDGLDALEERANIVKNDYPQYYNLATRNYLGSCMYQYQFLCRQPANDEYKRYKTILHKRFCDGDQKALLDGASLKYRFWYRMFRISPNLTAGIRNTLKIGM